jgi:hypothetical protein
MNPCHTCLAEPQRAPGTRISSILMLAAAALLSTAVGAQTLYAVSVRTYSDPGYKGIEGNLYTVAPETGATSLVASLSVGGISPIGLDGLAIHPTTGVFYGITAPTSAVIPRSLVKVDPETGYVTLIGDLGDVGSDIAFDHGGTLFIWLPNTRQLGTVNLTTGAVTPRGRPGERGASKGGFTVIGDGVAVVAATGANGTIDTVDTATGAITTGPQLGGAPFPGLISGLAYSPTGVIFAINTNFGTSSSANLVTVDASTGRVTDVGPLPNDTDAMTFGRSTASPKSFASELTQWRLPVLVLIFVFAVGVLIVVMRPRK